MENELWPNDFALKLQETLGSISFFEDSEEPSFGSSSLDQSPFLISRV